MREKVISQLEYEFEKEKFIFFSKYHECQNEFTEDDLIAVDDIKEMLDRMENTINEVDNLYNFMLFKREFNDEAFRYIHDDGLRIYNKYKRFISNCRGMLSYNEKEFFKGNCDLNELLSWIIYSVMREFKNIELELYNSLHIDIDYIIAGFNSCITNYNGVLFCGDERNKIVNEIAGKIKGKYIHEIALEEEQDELNLNLLNQLIEDVGPYQSFKIIVVIKNVDIAIFDDIKLRSSLLTFLSNIYESKNVQLFLTALDPSSIELIKELARINYLVYDNNCSRLN